MTYTKNFLISTTVSVILLIVLIAGIVSIGSLFTGGNTPGQTWDKSTSISETYFNITIQKILYPSTIQASSTVDSFIHIEVILDTQHPEVSEIGLGLPTMLNLEDPTGHIIKASQAQYFLVNDQEIRTIITNESRIDTTIVFSVSDNFEHSTLPLTTKMSIDLAVYLQFTNGTDINEKYLIADNNFPDFNIEGGSFMISLLRYYRIIFVVLIILFIVSLKITIGEYSKRS